VSEAELRATVCALVVRRLREERERQGISMTVLAARAGLAQATISFVERGIRNPTLDTLLRIAGVLDVELGALVTRASKDARRR
jgi:transcriptional regulator with XRE-family HTH domain